MPYSHVLLDFDHTLLDTDSSLEAAFVDAMETVGADPEGRYPTFDAINRALWLRVESGELVPQQVHIERFRALDAELGLDADPVMMADAFARGMGIHGDLYPGALELLDALAEVATLAMVTNGLSDIQRARIQRHAIGRHFDAIIISAEVGTSKPGAKIFDLTFEALGRPDRAGALMVGDSLSSDIAGGNNAGIDTCWYNPAGGVADTDHPATFQIDRLDRLLAVVTNG